MRKRFLGILFIAIPSFLFAQEKWDLRHCIDYAMQNNISVKQADVQARMAGLQLKQSQLNKLPSANLSSGLGLQFGRSIDPTTNIYNSTQLVYQNFQLQGGIEIFNWGRLKNIQQAAEFSAKAALTDVERTANDIGLNVASYYLQILAAKEQIEISQVQIAQTRTQYDITERKVNAGALPELNLAELESQIATDSSNLITAKSAYEQNLFYLKALLNIDMATPFDVETPPVESIPLESFSELQPESVYQLALLTQPLQKADSFRIRSAEKNIKAYRASMYPSLTLGAGLSTSFANTLKNTNFSVNGYSPITGYEPIVNIDGTQYYVQNLNIVTTQSNKSFPNWWNSYGQQLNGNLGHGYSLNISVPIFNNGAYRINYERSKLDLKTIQLQKQQDDQTLKSNIYNAYTTAVASMQKYLASVKSVEAAQKAYNFAQKRYDVGLLSTIDLLINQNNLLTAKLQQLANHYDYVFKMKVLEFYKGQGLKL